MEFSDETLRDIRIMGANGKTLFAIAAELNMVFDEMEDERKTNKKLDDALTRADKLYSLYKIDYIEKNLTTNAVREIYARHLEKIGDIGADHSDDYIANMSTDELIKRADSMNKIERGDNEQ